MSLLDLCFRDVSPRQLAQLTSLLRPPARLRFHAGAFFIFGDFTMQVPDSGGPFTADVVNFVDAKGNPVADTDVPVWASSDATIATVAVADATKPQEATVTLTGALGQAQVTATFGDPAAGGFVVTGSLEVIAGAAVSASMNITGAGVTAPAAPPADQIPPAQSA